MSHKKQLKQEYKQTPRPMGVFLIRNVSNDKVFLGSALDLNGGINRHKFQLAQGVHPNRALQEDWKQLGEGMFAFEILDQFTPTDNASLDLRRELEVMEAMWLDQLRPYGDRGYNERKLSREERLRRMSELKQIR
jgi:hypothetical protein